MSISKKKFGVQGYKNPKAVLTGQAIELARALEYLKHSPLKDGTMRKILKDGSEPLRAQLQKEYLATDPTGMAGRSFPNVIVKIGRRRFDRVYVGPDTRVAGWKLWSILQWGTVERTKKSGASVGISPPKRFIDKAVSKSRVAVVTLIGQLYEKRMVAYAKKLGFDIKGY